MVQKAKRETIEHNVEFDKLKDHFENLLTVPVKSASNTDYDKECEQKFNDERQKLKGVKGNIKISGAEIKAIVRKLRNGKAVGHQGVSNEMIKYSGSNEIMEAIAKLFEIIINDDVMPENMNIGELIVIPKDVYGDLSSVDNIRPITISDSIAVIFENYFVNIFREVKTDDNQFGFKPMASVMQSCSLHFQISSKILTKSKEDRVCCLL